MMDIIAEHIVDDLRKRNAPLHNIEAALATDRIRRKIPANMSDDAYIAVAFLDGQAANVRWCMSRDSGAEAADRFLHWVDHARGFGGLDHPYICNAIFYNLRRLTDADPAFDRRRLIIGKWEVCLAYVEKSCPGLAHGFKSDVMRDVSSFNPLRLMVTEEILGLSASTPRRPHCDVISLDAYRRMHSKALRNLYVNAAPD